MYALALVSPHRRHPFTTKLALVGGAVATALCWTFSCIAAEQFEKPSEPPSLYSCPTPPHSINNNTTALLHHQLPADTREPMVAIIIDDLGYQLSAGKQLLALDAPLTLAIIPFTPHGKTLAELAHQHHREVMVHAPMETLSNRSWEPALHEAMNQQQLESLSLKMLSAVPYARGMNNHGGSLLTQRHEHMGWLMAVLAEQQLYFVDSRTTPNTVAGEMALRQELPEQSRDIFLDNIRTVDAIRKQLHKLEAIALKHGTAIAIGHPYPETLKVLQEELPQLKTKGIQLRSVSDVIGATAKRTKFAQKTIQPTQTTTHRQPKG